MKFSTREDMDMPIDAAFAALADFDVAERGARHQGVEVTRLDNLATPQPGVTWRLRFNYRGKLRALEAQLQRYDPPEALGFTAESVGFRVEGGVALIALSRRQTRLIVELELRPKTLASRLIIQSMKLGKTNLRKRFGKRVGAYLKLLESRYRDNETLGGPRV